MENRWENWSGNSKSKIDEKMGTGEKILAEKLGWKILSWKIEVKNEFKWKILAGKLEWKILSWRIDEKMVENCNEIWPH